MSTVTQITASGETRDIEDCRIGDLSSLQTSEKESIVGAINEIAASAGGDSLFRKISAPTGFVVSESGLKQAGDFLTLSKNSGFLLVELYAEDYSSNAVGNEGSLSFSISGSAEVAQWARENLGEVWESPYQSFPVNFSSSEILYEDEPGATNFSVVQGSMLLVKNSATNGTLIFTLRTRPFHVFASGTHNGYGISAKLLIPLRTSAS